MITPPLYRAIPRLKFQKDKIFSRLETRRLPSNLPYIIDNIWEYLRPDHAPCRRHSVFGNFAPEFALKSALIEGGKAEDYVVCEIEFLSGSVKVAHLKAEDASKHKDRKVLKAEIFKRIGEPFRKEFSGLSMHQKLPYAPLFLPGLSKDEMRDVLNSNPEMQALEPVIKKEFTFWDKDISYAPQLHKGELFFEMFDDGTYRLKEIQ